MGPGRQPGRRRGGAEEKAGAEGKGKRARAEEGGGAERERK